MIKKESGAERKFETGARKQNAKGKGTPVLFPGDAYLEISKHFEDGADHYEPRNWEKGIPLSKLIDSLERHIAQEKMGLTDESHDRALAWNAVVYLATKLRIKAGILPKELDDLEGAYAKSVETKPEYRDGVERLCLSCVYFRIKYDDPPCNTCFGLNEDHPNWEPKPC